MIKIAIPKEIQPYLFVAAVALSYTFGEWYERKAERLSQIPVIAAMDLANRLEKDPQYQVLLKRSLSFYKNDSLGTSFDGEEFRSNLNKSHELLMKAKRKGRRDDEISDLFEEYQFSKLGGGLLKFGTLASLIAALYYNRNELFGTDVEESKTETSSE